MALRDYTDTYQLTKKKLYAVICVYRRMDFGVQSPVNELLLGVVNELKKSLPDYGDVNLAYVYETEGLMEAKPMERLEADTKPYFAEPCREAGSHNLDHVFFMGMAMLKKIKERQENAEYRLYLVTDERFSRGTNIVWEKDSGMEINPCFADLGVKFFLRKGENAGGEALEAYMNRRS